MQIILNEILRINLVRKSCKNFRIVFTSKKYLIVDLHIQSMHSIITYTPEFEIKHYQYTAMNLTDQLV